MHPEIVRDQPGACPICGMALEPRTVSATEEDNPELRDMTRRFWISVALTVPLLAIAMASMFSSTSLQQPFLAAWLPWIELLLATPVVLWAGWPFFQRGWASIVNRSTNMFTLIAIGTGVAYFYSLIATLFPRNFPGIVPRDERTPGGLLRSCSRDCDFGSARPGTGTPRPQPHRRCHSRAARPGATHRTSASRTGASKTFLWIKSMSAIACASVRVKKFRWTVWFSKVAARSTNR